MAEEKKGKAKETVGKKEKKDNSIIKQIGLFLLTVLATGAAGYLYNQPIHVQIRDMVMVIIGMSAILFRLRQIEAERQSQKSEDITVTEINKFYLFFIYGIVLSVTFPLLPVTGWPYIVLAVILALFSESLVGMMSAALFIFISVSLAGADFTIFYLYFACSMVSIVLFQKLDEEFKIGIPIGVSVMTIIMSTTAEVVLSEAGSLSIETFVIPCINVFITLLFFLIFLKYYSVTTIHKDIERYMTITDPEYVLMVGLKTKSKETYYHAIHVAYFSDKIAGTLGCNTRLAKAGGYYHRMNDFCEEATVEAYERLTNEHEFPKELCRLLLQYNSKHKKLVKKELAIVYFADAVVSSIMYLFKKNPEMEIAYEQVIDTIFDKKLASGILDKCELSLAEYNRMKTVFKEERLYYDFLR